MLTVSVHITGLDNAEARLTKLGASFMDFTSVLTSLAAKMIMYYENTVFDTEGAPFGGWVPLTDKTEAQKEKKWPGRGILERRGDLRHGWTDEVTPVSLFITNRDPKFLFHQLGTSSGPGRGHNIPARKMIGVNAEIETLIKTEIEADVRAKIDAVG